MLQQFDTFAASRPDALLQQPILYAAQRQPARSQAQCRPLRISGRNKQRGTRL